MEDFYAPGDVAGLMPVPPPSGEEQADDRISEPRMYYEEESVVAEDGITGRNQYYEEEETTPEETVIARSEYYEEEGKQPEDLISEPKATEESAVAAAEQEQPAAPAEHECHPSVQAEIHEAPPSLLRAMLPRTPPAHHGSPDRTSDPWDLRRGSADRAGRAG